MEPAVFVLQPDAVFHERYRVVRCIKAGGMGVVYEVSDQKTKARRALKVMLPGVVNNADHRARFAREATITGGIESDHIVRVTDAGIDEPTGTPFLVMELLRGEELADIVEREKTLPKREVVFYLWQAALALDKTHAAGIVHRDLKPENLFITRRDDGSPCVKIFDFGIAKVFQGEQAPKTRALGTPLYMAPEQIRGASSAIGPRADLYTLGHIAYALLAGEAYWQEEAQADETIFPLLSKIVAGATDPPSTRAQRRTATALPPGFDAWFLKATAVRVEDRFERATAMIVALAQALGVPSPAPSTLPWESVTADLEPTPAPAAPAPRGVGHTIKMDTGPVGEATAPTPVAIPAPPASAPAPPEPAPVAATPAPPEPPLPSPAPSEPAPVVAVPTSERTDTKDASIGKPAPASRTVPAFAMGAMAVLALGGVAFGVLRGQGAVAVSPSSAPVNAAPPPAVTTSVSTSAASAPEPAAPAPATASASAAPHPASGEAAARAVPSAARMPVGKAAAPVKVPDKGKTPKPEHDGIF